jgi:hypothetical protein
LRYPIFPRTSHLQFYQVLQLGIRDLGIRDLGIRDLGIRDLGIRDLGIRDLGIRDLGIRDNLFWNLLDMSIPTSL